MEDEVKKKENQSLRERRQREWKQTDGQRDDKSKRQRRHLCAAPALLPVLLLQLCVLHSQLEAGQLGHERLVTHMERIRDGELEGAGGGGEVATGGRFGEEEEEEGKGGEGPTAEGVGRGEEGE